MTEESSKIKVVWSPEGGSPREWVVDLARPGWDVMSKTEEATGWPWQEFVERFAKASGLAAQALLWVLRKRTEPGLTLESVHPMDPHGSLLDELAFEEVIDPPAKKSKKAEAGEPGEA